MFVLPYVCKSSSAMLDRELPAGPPSTRINFNFDLIFNGVMSVVNDCPPQYR